MLNVDKLNRVLAAYRQDFYKNKPNESESHWADEKYKWIAIQHFQKNWDIDAEDFTAMFKEATAKCDNLLTSVNYFPRGMILEFAKVDSEATRTMFRNLFDESTSVVDRINAFIAEAERIRSSYGANSWKSHFQNVNSVSTYLWLRYPDKYYIYKYSECKQASVVLESDFKVKKGAKTDVLLDFLRFYDEIAAHIARDKETTDLLHSALTPDCYPDPEYRTLTIDVGFYISRYYTEGASKDPVPPNPEYWPSSVYYPVNITKEQWKKDIEEVELPDHKGCMGMLKALMELGGEASCKKLSSVYGGSPSRYVGFAVNIGKRAKKFFNLPPCMDGDVERFFPIPFLGRDVNEEGNVFYSYKIREELFAALKEIDLSGISPYIDDGIGYWWLNANPKIWSFADIAIGEQQTYTLYNENGHKRRVFQNFLDAKPGDLVIGYESTPVKQVVAIAKITKEQDGKELVFEKTEGLSVPIDYQVLRDCSELENMEYFSQPQGSLFRLTKDEFDFIMDIIREENPLSTTDDVIEPYSRDDFLREVFMSGEQYDTLVSLLKNKSNLILQGAPGVGKTYAAKRLAYSIMKEKDESRIEFVQFHQNYSYEDFMMGYKPTENGFELKYGIFYRFCTLAANYPEKPFFFIIDEINRGNMSKIFGELLMLIEKDYRGTKTTLAYNGMSFSVPKNLYIIGMMNTADRSLAMIDYALRRRFSFFTMTPGFDTNGFKAYQSSLSNTDLDKLVDEVKSLNKAISNDTSLGAGFCIGHSYFCGHKSNEDGCWIREIVDYDIVPMLSEYWFDDPENVRKWADLLTGACNGK